ncbi:hypothetical protein UO65_2431 [Actinokineospora spheciospongiae]|uniref:Uncharacterized protein n=1 Tax=Actinokineospora spheciospongiae TaxID=909613 RepID=W7IZY6_9PSEU|nr:hypothetical protein UO65_2431 [Actinokineospora spheciospongiae]
MLLADCHGTRLGTGVRSRSNPAAQRPGVLPPHPIPASRPRSGFWFGSDRC